jgi:hypothetical protein
VSVFGGSFGLITCSNRVSPSAAAIVVIPIAIAPIAATDNPLRIFDMIAPKFKGDAAWKDGIPRILKPYRPCRPPLPELTSPGT